ncbi:MULTISPECIES: hypothetical protein [Borreliella]|uniref:Outer surface protein F n=1 Tax=Borrelia garinii subsp. bavariensis (strain ATCC BAA-2496 / DSM 23469 / PBi) TaxID=290434 RepID=A0ABM7ARP2_BORGP|nr:MULTISPECIES: hypothetical protein [Borreliella]AZA27243.1 hypothetical protein DB299_05085 [Borreliella bavariensis PBi]WLN24648.1 hypothetical protein IDK87_05225 [Borreliella bavariensis]
MNEKIKMFIICAVFALIISCKNYASSKDLGNLEQHVEGKVKGFLYTKKEELVGSLKTLVAEVSSKVKEEIMQAEEQVAQGVFKDPELKEIEKKIEELKGKINKSDNKTPLGTYSEYKEEVKKIREELEKKLKDKKEDKDKLEKELKELKESLKKKKDERKKTLEYAKQEFEEFKKQVDGVTGQTYGNQVQGQGKVGGQAWTKAKNLGLNVSYSSDNGTDSNDFSKKVIDDAIKKIEEELKNNGEEVVEDKKE